MKKLPRHFPKKRFGQHFLVDQHTINRIIDTLQLSPIDTVVEIGAGHGVLTKEIAQRVRQLTAIEIDRDIAPNLAKRYPSVTVRQEDVLKVEPAFFDGTRVVGNLPYNISTPLVTKLLDRSQIIDMHFMLQREVAQRITANPDSKSWGRLSVKVKYYCDAQRLFDVPPSAFSNPPQVYSSFVRLKYRPFPIAVGDIELWEKVVRMAFNQRRKKIANSLRSLPIEWDRISVPPSHRADQIDVDGYIEIANSLMPDFLKD